MQKNHFFIENSSSGRKPQTIGDRTSRIVVKSRWLWFVNDIVRYTGRLLSHTPFSSQKRKMTCIYSELLAHRVPHRWNTPFGFGLFVLDTKNKKSDVYERKYVIIMKMWFCFLAESATPAWPASSLWSRWSGLRGLALVRTSCDGDDDDDGDGDGVV